MSDIEAARAIAVIVAAGRGSRMNQGLEGSETGPKQYFKVGGKSLLGMACEAFLGHRDIDHVLVAIHPDDTALYDAAVEAHPKLLQPTHGGATRQESVLRALESLHERFGAMGDGTKVLIHDAARPLVDEALISRVIAQIAPGVGALAAIAVPDTIKQVEIDGDGARLVRKTVDRSGLYLAQTPQGFMFPEILTAHRAASAADRSDFTDDCAVGEWHGMAIHMVEGDRRNFKVTSPDDIYFLNDMNMMGDIIKPRLTRIGSGYDIHRTIAGGPIVLGGIEIESTVKLDGHSDADVVLHALTDALLGTIAAGDIGSHFPPGDEQWKGASSDRFLAHACALLAADDGRIENLDVTVIGETPKIGPHRDAMRKRISEICGISAERVSVKATTHERIGTIGRGEGIAALASASVSFPDET